MKIGEGAILYHQWLNEFKNLMLECAGFECKGEDDGD